MKSLEPYLRSTRSDIKGDAMPVRNEQASAQDELEEECEDESEDEEAEFLQDDGQLADFEEG